jgi:hypothetical protein
MKGQPRKIQRTLAKEKDKFPMRTMEIGKPMLEFNQEFFEIYDFVFLMFIVTTIMFFIITVIRLLPFEPFVGLIQTNLTFYIMVL